MLRLYAGRENIDKERFVYERIKERGGETLVLVPDQYTLAAEEQALKYLETDCLFDTEILSMNRLGLRVLTEQGTESVRMLDKYGRFMLLTKIIREHEGELEIFRRSAGKISFTTMLNDFISEFKQQNCNLEEMETMLSEAGDYPTLAAKIKEIGGVIKAYEASIEGRYTDPEDYISMYVEAMGTSRELAGKSVWIYGYDSVTPKFAAAAVEIAKATGEVNFVINRNDFGLDERLISMLKEKASASGIETSLEEIGAEYAAERSETVSRIEKYLWSDAEDASNKDFAAEDLTMVCAANPYYEAENAAAYIWHLIRDEGYKMKEIQVIANDEGAMQPIVRRVFAEYGLPVFSDSVRKITDTAAVAFVVNLLWFEVYNRAPQYLFAMLKTGLTEFEDSDIEDLENYVKTYHIRGSMWERDFKFGKEGMPEDRFSRLNEMRAAISDAAGELKEIGHKAKTEEFVPNFKEYLERRWNLGEAVEAAAASAEAEGLVDEAQRLVQSYDKAMEMLDQMVEIIGGEETDLAEFTELYLAGLADVDVGIIPATADGLSLGTMIRTRPRPIRAAVILGANEGILPMQPSPEGLFSVDEKDFFKSKGFPLGTLDDIHVSEENAAMYRMMSKPSDKIYISYALTGTDGKDAEASTVIESLKALFPKAAEPGFIKRDVISEGWSMDMINTPSDALRHLSVRLRNPQDAAGADELTRALLAWYRDKRADELASVLAAAGYDNDPAPLGSSLATDLFARKEGRLILSSSAVSNYIDCPFKYYVNYGLSPTEERSFETDSRSIGDAYHECLMAVARRLIGDRALLQRVAADDEESLERLVNEELDKIAGEYRGGLFISTSGEEYRLSRVREICAQAARAMAKQLGADSVMSATFEESFGRHGEFEPIKIKVGDEEVYVEGKIDRADILGVGGGERARIIDYKTGADKLDLWKMRHGYRMQLAIYLISASSGDYEPAGMFYFNIKDPIKAMNGKTEKNFSDMMAEEAEDLFKLKGVYINEEGVLDAMPQEVLASGAKAPSISRDEYDELKGEILNRVEETAEGILDGKIGIHPLKEDSNTLACNRCGYQAICRRDRGYSANYARELPKKPKEKKEDASGEEQGATQA